VILSCRRTRRRGTLLREQPLLRVIDGGGAIVLQGRLDADGECERAWPLPPRRDRIFNCMEPALPLNR
jgi:hypothetical protein